MRKIAVFRQTISNSDFRSTSPKCVICQYVYGQITKIYKSEYLEQHPHRAQTFLKIFLQKKNEDEIASPLKMEDPKYIHRVTGKPNVDGRQYRQKDDALHGAPYGLDLTNDKDVYGDIGYETLRKRTFGVYITGLQKFEF